MDIQTEVERHNAYGWIKPTADACAICGRREFTTPVDGFSVRACDRCERLVCERCADSDYDMQGDPGTYVCTQWVCKGDAQCQQIADGIRWAELGIATGRNDSCQRCPKKYGEPSPNCPNFREHAPDVPVECEAITLLNELADKAENAFGVAVLSNAAEHLSEER